MVVIKAIKQADGPLLAYLDNTLRDPDLDSICPLLYPLNFIRFSSSEIDGSPFSLI